MWHIVSTLGYFQTSIKKRHKTAQQASLSSIDWSFRVASMIWCRNLRGWVLNTCCTMRSSCVRDNTRQTWILVQNHVDLSEKQTEHDVVELDVCCLLFVKLTSSIAILFVPLCCDRSRRSFALFRGVISDLIQPPLFFVTCGAGRSIKEVTHVEYASLLPAPSHRWAALLASW